MTVDSCLMLPKHWSRVRLSRLAGIPITAGVDFSAAPREGDHLRYLRTTDIVGLTALSDHAVGVTRDEAKEALVEEGDILLTRSGSLGTSYLHASSEVMAYAGYLVRVRPKASVCDRRFLAWWTLSQDHLDQIAVGATRSTIDNFSASKFRGMRVPLPTLSEQGAIADFLDRETAKIDALIEKQNQLVGLLRERRESVVESVLRNAGPTGALGFFAHCLPGYAFAAQDFSQDEQDVRLLRGINVKPRATDWSEVVYWPQEAAVAFSSYQLVAGDIVLGMDRPFVGDGTRVAVIDEGDLPCLLLQRVLRVRPRAQVSSKFLYFALMTRSFREYATPEFTGVSVPHISDKQVRSFRLPVPDLGEQENLAARVGADVAKIDALIAKAEEFIALAKERRAALITAAVTGQIDVLGEAS